MSRSEPNGARRVGLAIVDPPAFNSAAIDALAEAGVNATFFVRPEVLVLDDTRWRFVRASGHEFGNGALLGVTDDGRLPNWTCAALEAEFKDCAKQLAELGQATVSSLFLPGRFHACAEGRYRHKVQNAFAVCLGDSERACSLGGVCGAIQVLTEPRAAFSGPAALVLSSDAELIRASLLFGWQTPIGPVSQLVN